jgi:hypothetical protein
MTTQNYPQCCVLGGGSFRRAGRLALTKLEEVPLAAQTENCRVPASVRKTPSRFVLECEPFCSDSLPRRTKIPIRGALKVERAPCQKLREYAEEALRWSSQSSSEEEKKALIGRAVTWTQAASLSERKSADPLRA